MPWAPYGFESRWQLAWVSDVQGDWDEVLALTDAARPGAAADPAARCWRACG